MELDLGTVRAFVAIADDRRFGVAADRLGLTQQAISKRIAKLETRLGSTLCHRATSGATLTEDGEAFLPHARALLALADQAVESVRGRNRPLRIDVLGTRLAPAGLVRSFHEHHADVEIDIIRSRGLRSALPALIDGSIDAAFARVPGPLDPAIAHIPACVDPHVALTGRRHPLAGRRSVRLTDLADSVTWMPGSEPGSEWEDYYRHLSREFPLTIATNGPTFSLDDMLDDIARSTEKFIFVGERMRVPWHPDIVEIPVVDPAPVYPWSLLWHRRNRHPALQCLVDHVATGYEPFDPGSQWLPPGDDRDGYFSR